MSFLNVLDCCFFVGSYVDVKILFVVIEFKSQDLVKWITT